MAGGVEVLTDRPVNASQLAHELGGAALRVVGPYDDGTTVVRVAKCARGTRRVTETQLGDAIAAHVADPDWRHPDDELELEDAE